MTLTEARGDQSGYSVAISYSGDILAIGTTYNDGVNGLSSGHIRAYEREPSSELGWVQLGNDIDGESSHDYSDSAVALSANGHVLASGVSNNNGNDNSTKCFTGHVRV